MLTGRVAADEVDGTLTDLSRSIRHLRVLCIGNEGVVRRDGQWWSYRCTGGFLAEMGGLVGETCWCAWSDTNDDPLKQTGLQDIQRVRAMGLPPLRGPLLRKLINGVSAFAMLAREVLHADFVYLYWPGRLSTITVRLCQAVRKPYGIYLRGEEISSGPTFRAAFRHARFALTTGHSLRRAAGAYCDDVEDVTPMTDVRLEHVLVPRPPRRSGPWRLLYVGRVDDQRKGVHDLLAALSYLDEWGLPFMLTMVGHCRDAPGLLHQLPRSVAQRVRVIGTIETFHNLAPFYSAADAFILASHDEGFPRVLYEAMAFGVPILTTFVGSIPDVMQDHENCLQIEVRNPKDIAEKIRYLLESPELQRHIARSSRACITEIMNRWKRTHAVQIAERLRDAVARRSLRCKPS